MPSINDNPLALMLSRFLRDDEQSSLLIHGPWGIGKTYALDHFLNVYDFRSGGRFVARSNVSVFGKSTLSEIQSSIFPSAQQVSSDELATKKLGLAAKGYLSLNKFLASDDSKKTFSFLARKARQVEVPWLGRVDAFLMHGNYDAVSDFLVVLDDLERHSLGVPLKDVLGLVAELVSHKKSKVIAICNEDALDAEELSLLNSFREKIFDVELQFQRSSRAVATIGLPIGFRYRDIAEDVFEKLNVSNIRVVRKFAYFVDQFEAEIESSDPRLVREILEHAALLTWARYDASAGIPGDSFPSLASEQHWFAAAMRDKDEERKSWELAWDAAASALQFSSQGFDPLMIDYLKTGVWIPGSLVEHLDAKKRDLTRLDAQDELKRAWKQYADSLDPDQGPLVASFLDIVERHARYLPPRDVDAVFSLLEDLAVDVSSTRDRYVTEAREALDHAANDGWPFGDFKSEALKGVVAAARDLDSRLPSIDAALTKMSVDRSWSEEDVAVLAACSDEDLVRWIRSEPDNLPKKIKGGLLQFRTTRSDDVRYKEIGEKAERVLRYFATLSELNRVRVENMFQVEL